MMRRTTRVRPTRTARPGPCRCGRATGQQPAAAERLYQRYRAGRSHRHLGVRRHRGLGVPDADAGQGRLREPAADPGGAGGRESGGHGAGRKGRPRLRRVRRAEGDARAGTRAHRLAGRRTRSRSKPTPASRHAPAFRPTAGPRRARQGILEALSGSTPAASIQPRQPGARAERRWRGGGGGRRRPRRRARDGAEGGKLKVVTTNLSPGFLRRNGVPYSANTTVTEYYNLLTEPTTGPPGSSSRPSSTTREPVVDYITSTNFRREPDDSKWRPRPCSLR